MLAWGVSPRLERRLLDIFWGDQRRRVPFPFHGYIPPSNLSWIPLHVYISDQYAHATIDEIMARIPSLEDKEFIEYLKEIGTAES